ncbi:Uma2 family endonuclease [Nocardia goodfellowii]
MDVPQPRIERPDLPEYMTWEELERLPAELAGEIELWDCRVVWCHRGPREHQVYTGKFWNALGRSARRDMTANPDHCWEANFETNVFLNANTKNDFVTPDFLVNRCLGDYVNVHVSDVLLAGEVLSPSNTVRDIEAKKARYAAGGIPSYWEVTLGRDPRRIAKVRAYGLEKGHGELPPGVTALRPDNYILAGEWSPDTAPDGIRFDFPFPIEIAWDELEF